MPNNSFVFREMLFAPPHCLFWIALGGDRSPSPPSETVSSKNDSFCLPGRVACGQSLGRGWPVPAPSRRQDSVAMMCHLLGLLDLTGLTVTKQGCEVPSVCQGGNGGPHSGDT